MPSAPPSPAASPPASSALSAFLRGIERRAFVFAQLQCGRDREALAANWRALDALSGGASAGAAVKADADTWDAF